MLAGMDAARGGYAAGSTLAPEASGRLSVGREGLAFLALRGYEDASAGAGAGTGSTAGMPAVARHAGKPRALSVRLLAPLQAELEAFQGGKGSAAAGVAAGIVQAAGGAVPMPGAAGPGIQGEGEEELSVGVPVEVGFGADLKAMAGRDLGSGSAPGVDDGEMLDYVHPRVLRELSGLLQVRLRSFALG